MVPCNIRVCLVFCLVILCCHANYVSVDDCTEPGAHRYHAHSAHSSAYTSGYTQTHPSPSGYTATSSSSMRTGNAVGSGGYGSSLNTGGVYGNEDDLQMASSVYSPQVVNSGYGSHRGSSAKYNAIEESATYGSRTSGSGYGSATTRTGYGSSGSGYGASGSGYGSTSYGAQDSQVREKFEDLKQKADAFVHTKDSPPPVPVVASHIGSSSSSSHSSQYSQHGAASGQRYGSNGNILGVTYGTTGTEEDDHQRLVPVQTTIPAASALTAGSHKESSSNSAISYSTSGVAPSTDEGVNFSISQNVPLGGVTQTSSSSQSKQFEELKRRAEAFVHEGAPPPSSSGIVTTDSQSSTNVQTLPVHATSHGTYVVPVRVTVTREQTVLPGETQEYYHTPTGSATKHISEYSSSSSHTSSGANVQPGYVAGNAVGTGYSGNTVSTVPIGSSSSYSYNSQGVIPPRVYTVGPQGSVVVPNEESSSSSSSTSYGTGSGYTKQTNVHRENVVVAGAVPIVDTEAAERRSNKLFDLVSGYGTFLPAKEEEEGRSSTTPATSGLVQIGSSGTSGSGSYGGSASNYGGTNSGYSSQTSSSRLTTGTSGDVYQPVPLSTGYSGVIPTSGTIPAGGTVRKTVTGYTYYSNPVPSQISPGVPVGDPLSPPEISGSYFTTGGGGGKHSSYSSKYESQSTSGGYGVRNEGVRGGYGVRNEGLSGTYGSGGVANENVAGLLNSGGYTGGVRDQVAYNSEHASRDASSAGYGVKNVGYASRGGYTGRDSGYASRDATGAVALDANCGDLVCDSSNLIAGSGGNVKKYGISSSWSSKSQTVNGKTTQSKEAVVTVNDNGKVDTYATHS